MHQFFFPSSTYLNRRNSLKQKVGNGQILLPGNEESSINFRDNWYPFRQDSSFLYYAGINLPGLCLLIDIDKNECILFGDELTIEDIVWTGPQPSLRELAEKAGITQVLPAADLPAKLGNKLHYLPPYRPEHSIKLAAWTGKKPQEITAGASTTLIKAIAAQREIKSKEEVEALHEAASITAGMHRAVMQTARPGMKEYQLVGVARQYLWNHHAATSFPSILTVNGQILHNHDHSHSIEEGDLILHDGGAESIAAYAGDMTRTFPAGRSFSTRQAEIYEVVLSSMNAAIAALRPGVLFRDVHLLSALKIVEGLSDLGLMKGDAHAAVKAGAHALFFPHGLGHMLGLDVHDMENFGEDHIGYTDELRKSTQFGLKSLRLGKALKEGFAVTIEPGIYLIPQLIDQFRAAGKFTDFINYDRLDAYRDFGGIRIEDDYVITTNGAQLLGRPLAKTVSAVEEIRAEAF